MECFRVPECCLLFEDKSSVVLGGGSRGLLFTTQVLHVQSLFFLALSMAPRVSRPEHFFTWCVATPQELQVRKPSATLFLQEWHLGFGSDGEDWAGSGATVLVGCLHCSHFHEGLAASTAYLFLSPEHMVA